MALAHLRWLNDAPAECVAGVDIAVPLIVYSVRAPTVTFWPAFDATVKVSESTVNWSPAVSWDKSPVKPNVVTEALIPAVSVMGVMGTICTTRHDSYAAAASFGTVKLPMGTMVLCALAERM